MEKRGVQFVSVDQIIWRSTRGQLEGQETAYVNLAIEEYSKKKEKRSYRLWG